MLLRLTTLLGLGAGLALAQDSAAAVPPTATIDIATLHGTQTSLPSATQAVNKYLGIPFAESPPVRFAPPQKKSNLNGVLDVQDWKSACVQQFAGNLAQRLFTMGVFSQPPPAESEDCLYLNVYAPASDPPPGGRAVMFWIFGGAFMLGHAGQPLYDGSAFAAYQDVIVVTANYRTNVFGFPTSPQLNASEQNLGLMDQRFALQWTQDNIAAFGGDPDKVTIFGESAGGSSVDILLTSYTTDNAPFRAAIAQSGMFSYQPQNYTNNPDDWSNLVDQLGCGADSNELECVRQADASQIQSIIQAASATFYPVPDGVTLVASPAAARAAGSFAKVPVLGGSNANEGRVYTVGMHDDDTFLNRYFGGVPQIIAGVRDWYTRNAVFPANAYYRLAQVYTDFGFLCPQGLWANASAAAGAPAWLYWYNASFPNSAFLDPDGDSGAYHSSEIGVVFQSFAGGPINPNTLLPYGLLQYQLPATDEQAALSRFVNKAWADFAKDPSSGPGWRSLGDDGVMGVLGGGSDGGTGVLEVPQEQLHGQCPLFIPLYQSYTPGAQDGLPGINPNDGSGNTEGGSSGGGGSGGSSGGSGGSGNDKSAASRIGFSLNAALAAAAAGIVVLAGFKI